MTVEEAILIELRAHSILLETLIEYHARNSRYGVSVGHLATAHQAREQAIDDASIKEADTASLIKTQPGDDNDR